MRDFYEGAAGLDLTAGIAAGPFGSPARYEFGPAAKTVSGGWERPISLYRTQYSFVNQVWANKQGGLGSKGETARTTGQATTGVVWFGPHAAHGTCYVPLSPLAIAAPAPLTAGTPWIFTRASAWWAHRYVANIANLNFRHMIRDVRAEQVRLEASGEALVRRLTGPAGASAEVWTQASGALSLEVNAAWWRLFDALMFKFSDGFENTAEAMATPLGYPARWLEDKEVGYIDGPRSGL